MLGKTNLLKTKENSTIPEVENYQWKTMKIPNCGDLDKAFYDSENGRLLLLTKNGILLWSTDGENWERKEFEDTLLMDIIWDGTQYVIVGGSTIRPCKGIIITSSDLVQFTKTQQIGSDTQDHRYYGIYYKNAQYIIIGFGATLVSGGSEIYSLVGDLVNQSKYIIDREELNTYRPSIDLRLIQIEKSADGFLICAKKATTNDTFSWTSYASSNGTVFNRFYGSTSTGDIKLIDTFECKGELFYGFTLSTNNKIYKLINLSESVMVSTNVNFAFNSALYFNRSSIFFNNHNMLIVKQGENIQDKVLTDLVEISFEHTIYNSVKAFDKIFLLCENGNILISTSETQDPGAVIVQTISGKKALHDAKQFTNEQLALALHEITLQVTEEGVLTAKLGDKTFNITTT